MSSRKHNENSVSKGAAAPLSFLEYEARSSDIYDEVHHATAFTVTHKRFIPDSQRVFHLMSEKVDVLSFGRGPKNGLDNRKTSRQ